GLVHGASRCFGLGLGEVCGDAMSPPQLARNAPVANVIEPSEPCLLMELWHDLQLLVADSSTRTLCHGLAVDIPLRSQERFNDVLGSGAKSESHLVVLLATVLTDLLECLLNGNSSIITHHSLKLATVGVDASIFSQNGDE